MPPSQRDRELSRLRRLSYWLGQARKEIQSYHDTIYLDQPEIADCLREMTQAACEASGIIEKKLEESHAIPS